MRTSLQVVVGVLAIGGALGGGFLWAMRTRFRPVQTAVRRMNRRFLNPRQLRTAGRPGAAASVVHHVGRRSGTAYRTPVVAVTVEDGYAIALPYGPEADWVQNVLAAGTATVEHDGRAVTVTRPTVVSGPDADAAFDAGDRRTHRLFGIADVLHLSAALPEREAGTEGRRGAPASRRR